MSLDHRAIEVIERLNLFIDENSEAIIKNNLIGEIKEIIADLESVAGIEPEEEEEEEEEATATEADTE